MANELNCRVVLPGESISKFISELVSDNSKTVLGPGLQRHSDDVVVTKCGILKYKKPNLIWVDSHEKRYIPVRGEYVIGIITTKGSEVVRVDIGAGDSAVLSLLSFEGATKRNKPNLQVGDLVYARVLIASKDMEPELVCMNSHGKSGELGVLPSDGFLFTVPLNLVRKILSPSCPLLKTLGEKIPYEVTVGANGRVWINANTIQNTLLVYNAISFAEYMTPEEVNVMCSEILYGHQ
ncbi:LOW QUALITY PROTEIN: exosome complex component Rrp40 [Tachypleus tridentatus]|uniref:LOW QUALITY PROTEIN: exosome complex component Rrp40 n=1 Tax=Tachypleus tridentatus TaxID=6853 RepID=UPI003FD4D895